MLRLDNSRGSLAERKKQIWDVASGGEGHFGQPLPSRGPPEHTASHFSLPGSLPELQGAQAPLLGSGSCLAGCHVFRDPGPASSIFSTLPRPSPSLQTHLEMQQPFPGTQASSMCGIPGRVKGRQECGSFCLQSESKFQYKRRLHQKSPNLAPSFTGKNICELRLGTCHF